MTLLGHFWDPFLGPPFWGTLQITPMNTVHLGPRDPKKGPQKGTKKGPKRVDLDPQMGVPGLP